MLQDIQDAINKNLPTQVGEALKKRLEQADQMERTLVTKSETINSLEATVKRLKDYEETSKNFAQRELVVAKAEREIEVSKAVMKETQCMTSRMLDMNKEIVLAVFANSKYKYTEKETKNFVTPSGSPPYPQVTTVTDVNTIETEGTPNG